MIFVLLAIICSTSINIFFKLGSKKPMDHYVVSLFNFIAAALVCFILIDKASLSRLLQTLRNAEGSAYLFKPEGLAFPIGLLNGLFIVLSLVVLQVSTQRNGSALTSTFNKLGVLIPTGLSILVFQEKPGAPQILGIALALLAILLVYLKLGDNLVIGLPLALLGTFFFGGAADFVTKLYAELGIEAFQASFILISFLFAILISAIYLLVRRPKFRRRDVLIGLATGVPNQLNSLFLLLALRTIPGYLVFAIYSAGVILAVQLVNALVFKERLTARQKFAVLLIVFSVVLLNL